MGLLAEVAAVCPIEIFVHKRDDSKVTLAFRLLLVCEVIYVPESGPSRQKFTTFFLPLFCL
jgi:hypothetical protein